MAVHFVYRSHYDNPGCFHVKRFDDDTLLAWFQRIWQTVYFSEDGDAGDHAQELLGTTVYSFGNLFEKIDTEEWPVPKSMNVVAERLNDALYIGEMKGGKNHIQILTDDDELEMAVYLFDDHYAAKHPDRVAFLMRNDWWLPDGMGTGQFKPPPGLKKALTVRTGDTVVEGKTYFAHFAAYDSGGLTDLDPGDLCGFIPGVRVPDLARGLIRVHDIFKEAGDSFHRSLAEVMTGLDPAFRTAKGTEVPLLKAVRANPDDTACWSAYSDWLLENGRPTLLERILAKCDAPSGHIQKTRSPKKDQVLVQSHVAQACKHVAADGRENMYHHLIFFDDLWANAHPELAASVLRVANRWDPL